MTRPRSEGSCIPHQDVHPRGLSRWDKPSKPLSYPILILVTTIPCVGFWEGVVVVYDIHMGCIRIRSKWHMTGRASGEDDEDDGIPCVEPSTYHWVWYLLTNNFEQKHDDLRIARTRAHKKSFPHSWDAVRFHSKKSSESSFTWMKFSIVVERNQWSIMIWNSG